MKICIKLFYLSSRVHGPLPRSCWIFRLGGQEEGEYYTMIDGLYGTQSFPYPGFLTGHEGHYDHKRDYEHKAKYLDLRDNGRPATGQDGHHSTYMYTQRAVDLIHTHNKSKVGS